LRSYALGPLLRRDAEAPVAGPFFLGHGETHALGDHMSRKWLMTATLLGFLAVALGAFGAHGLKSIFSEDPLLTKKLAWWNTGVRYQMWHALFLFACCMRAKFLPIDRVGTLIVVGSLLFSGSLYAMTLTGITKLGMITPLGGLAFLAAWAMLFWGAFKMPSK